MNTFPPTPDTAPPGEVRRFRPDAQGNPPTGWAWLAAASFEDGANYGVTDATTTPAADAALLGVGTQAVQSSQPFGYTPAYEDPTHGELTDWSGTNLTIAWPAGFACSRLIAARQERDGAGIRTRLTLLANGDIAAEPALAAQVYTYDGGWSLAFESTAECAAIDRSLGDTCQAFAWAGDLAFVRARNGDGSALAGYVAVNVSTGAIVALAAVGSLALSSSAARIIAADGLLAAVLNSADRLVRGRLFVVDAGAGTVSASASAFVASGFDVGDVSLYDIAAPEYALGLAPGDGSVLVSTEGGITRLMNDGGVLRAYQAGGPHPLVRAANSPATHPQRFASFWGAGLGVTSGTLRYYGAQGAAASNGGLSVNLSTHLAAFSRQACKL